ncbi:MAG: phosphatidate cytidylyltransferase [Actinobacteria bacterium]|nr:phosphatidate cytidylyltransferase [Actinomycetota bacterium]MCL5883059.1 phosphatidate cytidylyltransferase [Actinomycetota bacterium]
MLITRALVGTVGAILALIVVYTGGLALLVALIVLSILGLHEFYRMTRTYKPNLLAGYAGATLIIIGAHTGGLEGALRGTIYLFALTFILHAIRGLKAEMVGEMAVTYFGAFYVGVGFSHVILLRNTPAFGISLAFIVLLATWSSDTVAYTVGHFLGQRPISPVISPKKTIEGTLAGFVGTIVVVLIVGKQLGWMGSGQFFVLGLVIAVAAPLGDLFESYIKRASHVKDAGTIIPGHGGILDRFDSLLFAAVASFYIVAALVSNGS